MLALHKVRRKFDDSERKHLKEAFNDSRYISSDKRASDQEQKYVHCRYKTGRVKSHTLSNPTGSATQGSELKGAIAFRIGCWPQPGL